MAFFGRVAHTLTQDWTWLSLSCVLRTITASNVDKTEKREEAGLWFSIQGLSQLTIPGDCIRHKHPDLNMILLTVLCSSSSDVSWLCFCLLQHLLFKLLFHLSWNRVYSNITWLHFSILIYGY